MNERPIGPGERRIALALFLACSLLLGLTAGDFGVTWDEPDYIAAAESYAAWGLDALRDPGGAVGPAAVDRGWAVNHEHPPLDKVFSGVIWLLSRPLLGDLAAHRLGNVLLSAGLVAALFLLVCGIAGRTAGLGAAAALLAQPRFFVHAHLAALDVPAALGVVLFALVFRGTRERGSLPAALWCGLALGAALSTKITALVAIPVLLPWIALQPGRVRLLARLGAACLIAPVVLLASWPWLWHRTAERLAEFWRFATSGHWQVGQWYLGAFHQPPPWHFPFAMAVAVLPLGVLATAALGAAKLVRAPDSRASGVLLLSGALAPLALLAAGRSMVYDNDRLFLPAMPFFAALAGVGFAALVEAARRALARRGRPARTALAGVPLAAALFTPHLLGAAGLYPHWLAYYAETVGGVRGARGLGFETIYWCQTYADAVPFVNERARPGDTLWVAPWSHEAMLYHQLRGNLRRDVRILVAEPVGSLLDPALRLPVGDYAAADIVVLERRQTTFGKLGADSPLAKWAAARRPDMLLEYRGVPLMEVRLRRP